MTNLFTILYENRRSCGEIRSLTLCAVRAENLEHAKSIAKSHVEYDYEEDGTCHEWEDRNIIAIFDGVITSVYGLETQIDP